MDEENESDSSSGGSSYDEDFNSSSSEDEFDPEQECRELLNSLRRRGRDATPYLAIENVQVLHILLDKYIDEFCDCMTAPKNLGRISLGNEFWSAEVLDITEERKDGWTKFCQAIASISHSGSLKLYGNSLDMHPMVDILQSTPDAVEIELKLPLCAIYGNGARALVQALSDHSCTCMILELYGGNFDRHRSASTDRTILRDLLQLSSLELLSLLALDLDSDECEEIANVLSSNNCPTKILHVASCDGGSGIANALRSNHSVKDFQTREMMSAGTSFMEGLVVSLPLNTSIESFHNCQSFYANFDNLNDMLVRLVTAIATKNATMKLFSSAHSIGCPKTNEDQDREIENALKENYTLEHVYLANKNYCTAITELNQAGRRYVVEGHAASKSKCIDVLSHPLIHNNLDAIYFHLLENPVLFTGGAATRTQQQDDSKKRKASENGASDESPHKQAKN